MMALVLFGRPDRAIEKHIATAPANAYKEGSA